MEVIVTRMPPVDKRCRWTLGTKECGYVGPVKRCMGTPTHCRVFGCFAHYGAFPDMSTSAPGQQKTKYNRSRYRNCNYTIQNARAEEKLQQLWNELRK